MGHFAEIDENNVVLRVLVVDDIYDNDETGQDFLANKCDLGGVWKKTSYNTRGNEHITGGVAFRGNFAGIGMVYNEELDVFHSPQPHPSWTLNTDTYTWEAPTPMPVDGKLYVWVENDLNWQVM
jgi:hypothetical protein